MSARHRRFAIRCFGTLALCLIVATVVWAGQKTKPSGDQKVDLNTANEKDLESLPGVGPATAKKIIAGRPYASVDELSKAGVSAKVIANISPLTTVTGETAPSSKESTPPSQPNPSSKQTPPASSNTGAPQASRGTPGPGTVWVNLDSGVYHYSNSRYYGKTKNGKYMSEADATQAGYHAAKNEKKPQ